MQEDENIILFPKLVTKLKEESIQAIQEKRYEVALEKINKLIYFNIQDHEIMIGKLMCLMELGRYQEAEDMCEELIRNKQDEHYYHYVHLYLTILFQSNKYDLLMERIEEELSSDNIPQMLKDQFLQLYNMSENMESDIVEKKSSIYMDDLLEAVSLANHEKQWRSIMQLRKFKVEPAIQVVQLLKREDVHPVIKTAIFHWLQESNYSSLVNVHKFGQQLQVNPEEILEISLHSTYKKTIFYLDELEQENPTLYRFLEQLLYRYLFVCYPLMPSNGDANIVAESLKMIGYQMMNQQEMVPENDETRVVQYMEDILNCEQLYLSIIED